MKKNIKKLTESGIIAAIYVALTIISAMMGLASGAVQVRISEILCVLPIYTTAAIPGVTVGCLIANIICGGTIYDIIFGTLATLIGSLIAYLFRKWKYVASIPTIISNAIIIPLVLIVSGVGTWDMLPYFMLTVGVGEIISCGVLGTALIFYLEKHRSTTAMLFGKNKDI